MSAENVDRPVRRPSCWSATCSPPCSSRSGSDMSDTTAGLLQLGAPGRGPRRLLPPARRLHGPGLHQRARPARSSAGSTALIGVDPARRPALAGLRRARCSPSRSSACSASTRCNGCSRTCRSASASRRSRRTQAFNTAASFVTNTNWQSYSGESDDGPPRPRWPASPCRTSCPPRWASRSRSRWSAASSRSRTDRLGNFWVDLARGAVRDPAAARRRRRARAGRARRGAEPLRRDRRRTPWPGATQHLPAARSPRRRRSRSSAPTAAASSTPTRRTRSRTRTR